MNRHDKQLVVDALKQDFAANEAAFLVGVQGLSVEQMHSLRKSLHKHDSELKIAKNTLLRIAISDNPAVNKMASYLKQQVGVIFVKKDFASVAKVLSDTAKTNPKLRLITGCIESDVMDIKMLAALGSRETQIARLCGVLKANVAQLAMVLKAVSEKQQ